MTQREGTVDPMRIAILFVIAAASALPGAGLAQDAGSAVACPSIESDSERLACYDRALRTAPHAPTASPGSAVATSAPPPTAGATSASGAGAAPAAVAGAAGVAAAATVPSPQPAPQAGAAPAVEPSANPPVGIVPIVVLSTRLLPGRGVEFTTNRGDVWVQADTKPLQLPPTPFNAQIKPGTLGGVFLVPDNRLGIRVRHRD
jgi:hypothetical protein